MIKIEGKDGKKIIKKEIEIEYIDFNMNNVGELVNENVCASKLKEVSLDNNIEALHFIGPGGGNFEIFIEKIITLSIRDSTVYISAFCPDLFFSCKKESLLKQINRTNIKVSPILTIFEDTKNMVRIKRFIFPRFWTKYMKMIWLKNNNYPSHSNKFTGTSTFYKVLYIKNIVILKYYIRKCHKNYIHFTKKKI